MQHTCTVTVLRTPCFADLQHKYLADPDSGPCPCFSVGQTFTFHRTPERDDFYALGRGTGSAGQDFPCGEAWDAISRYIYTALQGGSIMHRWTKDERLMIACCNDGTRPVTFKIERQDIPETPEEEAWLAAQDFSNSAEDAYTG
ncbi:MAG: TIGR04076 family protein [Eggerthellaceae bacterium]